VDGLARRGNQETSPFVCNEFLFQNNIRAKRALRRWTRTFGETQRMLVGFFCGPVSDAPAHSPAGKTKT